MSRTIAALLLLFVVHAAGLATAQNSNNICNTTHVGHCYTDVEWNVGWYWANNPPSIATCVAYHQMFTMGDFWGMCNHLDLPDREQNGSNNDGGANGQSQSDSLAFKLTSQSHEWRESDSNPCPFEGLDPIIDYDNGTFTCATSF